MMRQRTTRGRATAVFGKVRVRIASGTGQHLVFLVAVGSRAGPNARRAPAAPSHHIPATIVTQVALGHASISRADLPRIHSLSLSDKLSAQRVQKRDSA